MQQSAVSKVGVVPDPSPETSLWLSATQHLSNDQPEVSSRHGIRANDSLDTRHGAGFFVLPGQSDIRNVCLVYKPPDGSWRVGEIDFKVGAWTLLVSMESHPESWLRQRDSCGEEVLAPRLCYLLASSSKM